MEEKHTERMGHGIHKEHKRSIKKITVRQNVNYGNYEMVVM